MAANTRITDFRVSVGIMNNRKVKRLRRELGGEACWSLVVLWAYCAGNEPDGRLAGWSVDDLESAAEWDGEPAAFAEAVTRIGLVDEMEHGGFEIHDWEDNQQWIIKAEARSIMGRKAAAMRWGCGAHAEGNALDDAERMRSASKSDAEPMPPSIPVHSSPIQSKHTLAENEETPLFTGQPIETEEPPGGPPPILTGRMARDFDWLWSRIPREMHGMGRKADAQKAFKKLKIDNDLVQVIDLKIFMEDKEKEAKRASKEFVPGWCALATYLNGRRWE